MDGVDCLSESRGTGAALDIVDDNTLGVGSTRVGLALLHGLHAGDGRRVPFIPRQAVADGPVSDHPAARVWPALVAPAQLPVLDAPDEGVAGLTPGTGTDRVPVVQLTNGFDPAGRGFTGVTGLLDKSAADVRVTVVARLAGTDGVVVGGAAVGVSAAELITADREALPAEPVAVLVLGTVGVDEAFCRENKISVDIKIFLKKDQNT